jgi:predicted GTPase
MTAVQQALLQLRTMLGPSFVPRLMFAINKVDVTAPGAESWNALTNTPSSKQRAHLQDFERYVHEKIVAVLPEWQGEVVSYSSRKQFRLDQLMTSMVGRAADDRAWLLDQRADVADFRKTISPEILAYIEEQEGLRKSGGAPWSDRRAR